MIIHNKDIERLRNKYTVLDNGCWRWTAASDSRGRGYFELNRESKLAHRVSFFIDRGYLPKWPRRVCHKCNNNWCINPKHLYDGTSISNAEDLKRSGKDYPKRKRVIGSVRWTRAQKVLLSP